jgi:uncharacterized protein YndB with AHSA1/START domain
MTTLVDHASDQAPVIVMTRIFDAPREMVWRVFTQPEHIVRWWGGEGFTNPVCEMDLRPGGLWRHVMCTPDGTEMAFNFVFTEVEPPSRLAWRETSPRRPGDPPSVLQTVTLEDLGDGRTRWTLVARADSFADRDAAVRSGYSTIITQSLDRLSAYLTTF